MKYLIAGLGNIGPEYDNTRHNIGFEVVDHWAEEAEAAWKLERLALHTELKFKGRQIHLIKPTTYMNRSGKSLRYWMTKLDIPVERVLVIVDDLALPFGKLRLKAKGSDGGHNGMKDIQEELGSNVYPRLRFGIGDDFHKGQQVDFVLSKWSRDEEALLSKYLDESVKIIKSWIHAGLARTMNTFN